MENQPPEGISRDKNNVIYVSGISLPFYVRFIEIFSLTLKNVRYEWSYIFFLQSFNQVNYAVKCILGSHALAICFRNIVDIMTTLPEEEVTRIAEFYFEQLDTRYFLNKKKLLF